MYIYLMHGTEGGEEVDLHKFIYAMEMDCISWRDPQGRVISI